MKIKKRLIPMSKTVRTVRPDELKLMQTDFKLTNELETKIKECAKKEGLSQKRFLEYLFDEFSSSMLREVSPIVNINNESILYFYKKLSISTDKELHYPDQIFNAIKNIRDKKLFKKKTYNITIYSLNSLKMYKEFFKVSRDILVESLLHMYIMENDMKNEEIESRKNNYPEALNLIMNYIESADNIRNKLAEIISLHDPIYQYFSNGMIDLLTHYESIISELNNNKNSNQ